MYLWIKATANSNTIINVKISPNAVLADLWINKCLKDRFTTIRTVSAKGRTVSDTTSKKYNKGIRGYGTLVGK